jgi:hypothetical protein
MMPLDVVDLKKSLKTFLLIAIAIFPNITLFNLWSNWHSVIPGKWQNPQVKSTL